MKWKVRWDWTPPVSPNAILVQEFEDEAEARICMSNLLDTWPEKLRALCLVRPDTSAAMVLAMADAEQWRRNKAAREALQQSVTPTTKGTLS